MSPSQWGTIFLANNSCFWIYPNASIHNASPDQYLSPKSPPSLSQSSLYHQLYRKDALSKFLKKFFDIFICIKLLSFIHLSAFVWVSSSSFSLISFPRSGTRPCTGLTTLITPSTTHRTRLFIQLPGTNEWWNKRVKGEGVNFYSAISGEKKRSSSKCTENRILPLSLSLFIYL